MLSRPVSDYNNCIVHLCQPGPSGRPHKATNNWGIGNGSELADYQLGRFYLSVATAREHRPYSLRVYLFWELLVDALFLALGVIHGAIVMPLVIQLSLQLRITSTNPTRKIKAAGVRISLYMMSPFYCSSLSLYRGSLESNPSPVNRRPAGAYTVWNTWLFRSVPPIR